MLESLDFFSILQLILEHKIRVAQISYGWRLSFHGQRIVSKFPYTAGISFLSPALNETPAIICCPYAKHSSKQHNDARTI